jgi:hypothetical protein
MHSCKNSECSQHGVTWETDATGFPKCVFGFPLIFPQGSYKNNNLGTSDTTSYFSRLDTRVSEGTAPPLLGYPEHGSNMFKTSQKVIMEGFTVLFFFAQLC